LPILVRGSSSLDVTFEDLGEKTHITLHSVVPDAAARDKVVKEVKAIESGYQTLEHLEKYLLSRR